MENMYDKIVKENGQSKDDSKYLFEKVEETEAQIYKECKFGASLLVYNKKRAAKTVAKGNEVSKDPSLKQQNNFQDLV